ncbi:MAG: Glycosylphosphatidylinositol (GPI) anchor assembly protein [Pleopsidium flavum]|nr:MAG: Glycosylphosphatidylinositol (GPI) anchor assembly protein [Pleopsidium flavum]
MTSTELKPRKLQSTSVPIDALPTQAARLYTHIHPFLVLGVYYIRFSALVVDPVSTLLTSLIPLSILQVSYVVTCLPPAKGSLKQSIPTRTSKQGQRKKPAAAKAENGLSSKFVPALLSLLLAFILGGPVLTVLLILFGAPLTTHFPHTFLCAIHMSLLAGLPLVYVQGVDATKWREVASVYLPFDEVFGGTVGTLLGAWFGAVPIPLDWDRDWQKWPITIVTGAYLGYVVGKFAGGYLLRGKKLEFD